MSAQACEPCAKRKVRCDKGDPCQNCKRRKTDQCIYPDTSPFEKIKKLEALVKSLGGTPESDSGRPPSINRPMAKSQAHDSYQQQGQPQERATRPSEDRSRDPVIVEEDGHSFYLESCVLISPSRFRRQQLIFEDVHGTAGMVMPQTVKQLQGIPSQQETIPMLSKQSCPVTVPST